MKKFQIRKFRKNFAKRCQEIIYSCIETAKKLNRKEKSFLKKKYSIKNLKIYGGNSNFFVVFLKSRIIATGRLTKKKEIATVYVDPKFQKRGAGKFILNYLTYLTKKKNYKKVFVRSLLQSVDFYKKIGFFEKKKLSKPIRAMRMEKNLC